MIYLSIGFFESIDFSLYLATGGGLSFITCFSVEMGLPSRVVSFGSSKSVVLRRGLNGIMCGEGGYLLELMG
jgi:hypothetical protein